MPLVPELKRKRQGDLSCTQKEGAELENVDGLLECLLNIHEATGSILSTV